MIIMKKQYINKALDSKSNILIYTNYVLLKKIFTKIKY